VVILDLVTLLDAQNPPHGVLNSWQVMLAPIGWGSGTGFRYIDLKDS
jgi:hypothetical protein